jgi:hypothetical protein
VTVDARVDELRLLHSTLVPGRRVDENGVPLESHLPSIAVHPANHTLTLSVERSITGPITAPSEIAGLTAKDSIIDGAARDDEAAFVPALVSGPLAPIPLLTSPLRRLVVSVDTLAPRTIALPVALPGSLAQRALQLQTAIRTIPGAASEQKRALVVTTGAGLILLGGGGTRIRVTALGNDPTAAELGLDEASSRQCLALFGARRDAINITSGAPSVGISIDAAAPVDAQFAAVPNTPAAARTELRQAIHAAGVAPTFTAAEVVIVEHRLLVIPGGDGRTLVVRGTAGDLTTVHELGLASARAAIAGDAAGDVAGPAVTLDETTVLGRVHVRQIDASNCVFDERVIAERRQTGCVRFSYVAPHSQTPRRFRCQPDLDARVEPAYTSRRWGDAAYAQLSLACSTEIRTGAEDGAEMGAFRFLLQPQRETNLLVRLDEYLPFGLDAALIFVT